MARSFEVLLSTLTALYAKAFDALRPAADAALREVANIERPRGEFEQVKAIQTSLAVLECNVVNMRQLLMSLLDNDDDLHMLYLTKVHDNPSLLQGDVTFDVDEVVAILEAQLQDIYGIVSHISLMMSNIQHTARVVDLMWTSKRNYLLLIDMSLRVMLMLMYCTNYWTGAFGQNLKSNVEENEGLFWGTSLVCTAWTFGAYGVVCKVFLARGLSLSWHKRV
ncbi:hypothetical protein DYB32_002999 [Aphanomyces invadans]|uniref:Magnesium transporter n=1 Tax=Aphanomyces invadans TaxID=157072 RepID=A0A3R6W084_9STRA|nr:hypothetical protein DYB32_002999 [Aphanomyces invadans]